MANKDYARVCVARLLGDFARSALFVRFGVGLRASARSTGKDKKINKINARARMGHPAPPCICIQSRQQFCFFGVTGIHKNVHLKGTSPSLLGHFCEWGGISRRVLHAVYCRNHDLSRKKVDNTENSPYTCDIMNLLPQKPVKERELTPQQRTFLDNLFENGGNVTQAAVDAGYSKGSSQWLKKTLADEIVERTKDILSVNAIKAANRLVTTIDNPAPERGDDLRLKAAESLLTRVGVRAPEQINHNVTAVHGVVLLPPKNEVIIDG